MNLRNLLLSKKSTPLEIAKNLHVSKVKVDEWCNGIGCPNARQAILLSKALGCDVKDVYLAILNTPYQNP